MGTIWIAIAVCSTLRGQCAWSPPSPMPSREACAQYARKIQIQRKQPMNAFKCLKVEVK